MAGSGSRQSLPESEWDDMILVGFIARTHGNKGQVILNSETDFPEIRFRVGAQLYGRKGTGPIEMLEIGSVRFQQNRPIIGFVGVSIVGGFKEGFIRLGIGFVALIVGFLAATWFYGLAADPLL